MTRPTNTQAPDKADGEFTITITLQWPQHTRGGFRRAVKTATYDIRILDAIEELVRDHLDARIDTEDAVIRIRAKVDD